MMEAPKRIKIVKLPSNKMVPQSPPVQTPPPPPASTSPVRIIAPKIKTGFGFTGKNAQRVKKELEEFQNLKDEDPEEYEGIVVKKYVENGMVHPQMLRVYITGRQPTEDIEDKHYFPGKMLKARMEFRENYPEEPPLFIFQTLRGGVALTSMNVYGTGEVCHYVVGKEFWKKNKSNVAKIVREIQNLLYNPNEADPANLRLADMFANEEGVYWAEIEKQVPFYYQPSDMKE